LSGDLPARAILFRRGAGVQDLQSLAPECPQACGIHESDHHLRSDAIRIPLDRIDDSRRKMFGSYNCDGNHGLRKLPSKCLCLEDGLRQQRNHPIAPTLRGSLDLDDVFAPSTLHNEVGLRAIALPRVMDAPRWSTKSVGYESVKIVFSGSHHVSQ
jgi:hypothetical protein